MTDLKKIAHTWLDAFNEHNIEKLLTLYDEQSEHYSPKLKEHQPETNGWIRGKPALRGWWMDAFKRLPHLNYQLLSLTADGEQVFMEYIRKTPGEADLRVAEVLVIRNDKIVGSRVFHS